MVAAGIARRTHPHEDKLLYTDSTTALDSQWSEDGLGEWQSSSASDEAEDESNATVEQESPLLAKLQQVENENVSGVLKRLDSIRQLAGDAQVLRHKERHEQNTRRLAIDQMYSLLLEEAEFKPQAVMQRNILALLEGIKVQNTEIFFFSAEEARRKLLTGPSVKLRDALSLNRRCAERLLVNAEVLGRMLAEITTTDIWTIVAKGSEYLTFKQTTYQVKPVEERDTALVKNATGMAVFGESVFVADTQNHCLWRICITKFTEQGNYSVERFAGFPGEAGFKDGQIKDARFSSPMGIVACDVSGSLFVTDTDNNAVRQIDLETVQVRTIEMQTVPLADDFLAGEFLRPKGICVVKGDLSYFATMDLCHRKQGDEFAAEIRALNEEMSWNSSGGSSFSSETETSASFSSSRSSSGEDSDSSARPSRKKHSTTDTRPSVAGGHRMLTLEQSLSMAQIKKYSVLQDIHDTWIGMRGGLRQTLVGSVATSSQSFHEGGSQSTRQSRRESLVERTLDLECAESQQQTSIRLAVTTDHCIWLVDPVSGRTQLVAGDPVQYGYRDAGLGLAARFSAPKGLISIRSVLFVADYWNNVVRCINLFTTQVDTVMDFHPQGPVAMCLSTSGVLYTLDSEGIHHANILRIMSTMGGGEIQSIGKGGKSGYQALFSSPQTRHSSMVSDSTFLNSEIWDAVRRRSVRETISLFQDDPNPAEPRQEPAGAHLSRDFQNKLQDYMKEVEKEKDSKISWKKPSSRGGRSGSRKHRKGRNKTKSNENKSRDDPGADDAGPDDGPTAVPTPMIQVADAAEERGSQAEGRKSGAVPVPSPLTVSVPSPLGVCPSPSSPSGVERRGSRPPEQGTILDLVASRQATPSQDDLETVAGGGSQDSPKDDRQEDSNDVAQALTKRLNMLVDPASSRRGSRLELSGVSASKRNSLLQPPPAAPPEGDWVQEIKLKLSRMGSSNPGSTLASRRASMMGTLSRQGSAFSSRRESCVHIPDEEPRVPLTLSDLGIQQRASRSNSVVGVSGALQLSTQTKPEAQLTGPSIVKNIDKDALLIFQERQQQQDTSSADAGTVMVRGGKAFYRSQTTPWSDRKGSMSIPTSRRGSIMDFELDPAPHGLIRGEDEFGHEVKFFDLTDLSRRGSTDSRRSSIDGSRRGSNTSTLGALEHFAQTLEYRRASVGRRDSLLSVEDAQRFYVKPGSPQTLPDLEPGNRRLSGIDAGRRLSGIDTARRASGMGIDAGRRPSGIGVEPGRRASGIDTTRRLSGIDTNRRGSGIDVMRRGSATLVDSAWPGDLSGSRRGSMQDRSGSLTGRRGSMTERRGSMGSLAAIGEAAPLNTLSAEMPQGRRISHVHSRKNSMMSFMPTVLDNEEGEEAESDLDAMPRRVEEQLRELESTAINEEDEDADAGADDDEDEDEDEDQDDPPTACCMPIFVSASAPAAAGPNKASVLSEEGQSPGTSGSGFRNSMNNISAIGSMTVAEEEQEEEEEEEQEEETAADQDGVASNEREDGDSASFGSSRSEVVDLSDPSRSTGLESGGCALSTELGSKNLFVSVSPFGGTSRSIANDSDEESGTPSRNKDQDGKKMLLAMMMNKEPEESPFLFVNQKAQHAGIITLSNVPFTRDLDLGSFSAIPSSVSVESTTDLTSSACDSMPIKRMNEVRARAASTSTSVQTGVQYGSYKVAEQKASKTWTNLTMPESLASVGHAGKSRKYPNTPLAIVWYSQGTECFLLVGLLSNPSLLKVTPPKHHEPDKGGRFNVLPVGQQRFLLADESSNQIYLVNNISKTKAHLAGCGKRGYLDGPVETCRMDQPCSLALDPQSHHIYVADRGNHVIRKLDLLSGQMSTVAGSGVRGNCDGSDRRWQALDSPFEVSFAAPHHLIISCADNSVRGFNLKTGFLETLLIGS